MLIHSIEPPGDDCARADAGVAPIRMHNAKLGIVVPGLVVIVPAVDAASHDGGATARRRSQSSVAKTEYGALHRNPEGVREPCDFLPDSGRKRGKRLLLGPDIEPPGKSDRFPPQKRASLRRRGKR